MCIAPYRRTIKTMCIQDKYVLPFSASEMSFASILSLFWRQLSYQLLILRFPCSFPFFSVRLELEFEERLLYQKISYNTWALPLRLLHSPLQDNVTVLLLILQSVLVFCKLEGYLDLWPWVCIFAPVWIFDLLFFVCCVIWFYFLAKSLLPQDYADTCLSGWLKDVLEAVQLGHIWSDYLKFASVSLLAFLVFPLFLVLQLDVFFGLYLYGSVLSPSELSGDDSTQTKVHAPQKSSPMSWTAVFSPLVVASLLVLHMLHKRYVFLRQNRRRNRLGMVAFLILVDLCALAFCVLIALQLDKWSYLPAWWTWWHTSTPVWIAAAIATIMIGEGFNFTLRANWWRRLQRTPYSITRAPLIGLLAVFLGIVFYRAEQARTGGNVETSVLFPFSFLFGLQSVLVLYWVQDLVDFDGHKSYTMRKKFNFNLQEANSAAMQEQLAEQDDLDDVPLVHL